LVHVLEAIFRRPLQLLLLMAVLPVVGVAIPYFGTSHTYQSTATLWALQRYLVIGANGPETDLLASPAETQSTALSELLQIRVFALSIAKEAQLESTLKLDPSVRTDPSLIDDALFLEISHNVLTVPLGYNSFSVSYVNHNQLVAQKVVEAVIHNFVLQSQALTAVEGQNFLDTYQPQLTKAKQDLDTAAAAEAKYLQEHPELAKEGPELASAADPHYAQLHLQTQQAQGIVLGLQTTISTLEQEIATQGQNTNYLFKILDPPSIPDKPVSRTKLYMVGGGIGLVTAILLCALFLVILVRRDRAVYDASDLQKITVAPVMLQIPRMPSRIIPLLVEKPHHA
jgi:uncharacterized protein involved in exopolysaccharide biosynthesis